MVVFPLHYQVVGQDDYMLEIRVSVDGEYLVNSGDYTSHTPRRGTLDKHQRARLTAALEGLVDARDYPAPEGAIGFVAELALGEGPQTRRLRFWEGALDEAPALSAAVRAIETL
jgi:hypothetical protein